ncbi:uncharacterized protein G2W53_027181 [Senna tora]|uniref:Uncharacterized protein n=1 Tax=Senna tora TaxID=362788 RepID=A0A834TIV7_9FABA|nr:uncharacterized protein G2W53_027181 [Senna tora]
MGFWEPHTGDSRLGQWPDGGFSVVRGGRRRKRTCDRTRPPCWPHME